MFADSIPIFAFSVTCLLIGSLLPLQFVMIKTCASLPYTLFSNKMKIKYVGPFIPPPAGSLPTDSDWNWASGFSLLIVDHAHLAWRWRCKMRLLELPWWTAGISTWQWKNVSLVKLCMYIYPANNDTYNRYVWPPEGMWSWCISYTYSI